MKSDYATLKKELKIPAFAAKLFLSRADHEWVVITIYYNKALNLDEKML